MRCKAWGEETPHQSTHNIHAGSSDEWLAWGGVLGCASRFGFWLAHFFLSIHRTVGASNASGIRMRTRVA